jgi:hypothetical protein
MSDLWFARCAAALLLFIGSFPIWLAILEYIAKKRGWKNW